MSQQRRRSMKRPCRAKPVTREHGKLRFLKVCFQHGLFCKKSQASFSPRRDLHPDDSSNSFDSSLESGLLPAAADVSHLPRFDPKAVLDPSWQPKFSFPHLGVGSPVAWIGAPEKGLPSELPSRTRASPQIGSGTQEYKESMLFRCSIFSL